MGTPLAPNEHRWCDWIATLEPHEQVPHDEANWTSCAAFCGGIESEAARLMPLLRRCKIALSEDGGQHARTVRLLADLSAELGEE